MVTTAQLQRLTSRIDALEQSISYRPPVIVWVDIGESVAQALARAGVSDATDAILVSWEPRPLDLGPMIDEREPGATG